MKATTRVTICDAFLMVLLGSAFGQHIQTDLCHHGCDDRSTACQFAANGVKSSFPMMRAFSS
jgi:hypothetical protein